MFTCRKNKTALTGIVIFLLIITISYAVSVNLYGTYPSIPINRSQDITIYANWTDNYGRKIPVPGYAIMEYQNSTGDWKNYSIQNTYQEPASNYVDPINITNGWTIIRIKQFIPTGTATGSYNTNYYIGV